MALEFEFQDEGLVEALANLPKNAQDAIVETVKQTTERGRNIVKFKTPTDSGRAINGWDIRYENGGERGVFFNEVPYINVLEYGGYPVRPIARASSAAVGAFIRGKAVLGGLSPGPRTQRSQGGAPIMRNNVSKQAPQGMVRSTLIELEDQFIFDLQEALDKALA